MTKARIHNARKLRTIVLVPSADATGVFRSRAYICLAATTTQR